MSEFVHLHVHSQYSLLDGAIRVKDLAKQTKALGMGAVALTDHANMFGTIQLHKACKEHDVKPIIGCEINIARGGGEKSPVDHLVLLAASEQGYKNLVRIVSAGHIEPASQLGPSVTLETVAKHQAGLIGLTGCMGGVLAQKILEQGETAGFGQLESMFAAFEKGSLYIELQDHGLPEQQVLNEVLVGLANRHELPLVATNDVHFEERSDGNSQLYLSCIAQGRQYADGLADHHGSFEMFLKSPDEMAYLFRDNPGAISNTLEIAERCTSFKLKLGKPMLPHFPVPEGVGVADYFRQVSREGLARRFVEFKVRVDEEAYRQRLEMEMDIIVKMDFPGYFLIVWDFVKFAKENNIPVGPGRGSGAGSLVAYSLRITDLDPIPCNLLFERFLNPERVSMPDFDIDFCMSRRDLVVEYCAKKYGKDSVGKIGTFHEMKAKSAIKDVGKAMRMTPVETMRISNLIPPKGFGQMHDVKGALIAEPKLKALQDSDPLIAELLATVQELEGLTRHVGLHASGVVISDGPLWEHVPCFKNGDIIATQYDMEDVEQAGLVKFDFLGLKTLTVIDIAVDLINRRPDMSEKLDISQLPMDDKLTFQLLQSGDATGIFQLEGGGMQQLFRDMKPDKFMDISAAVALFRPGPLGSGMVKDFTDCKNGKKPTQSLHPLVDDKLEDTYGVIVYQEQVMQIVQQLAGYTLGGADLLRRAMGKKKPEEMAKQRAIFIAGAEKNVSRVEAERIFDLLNHFSDYGFNRCVDEETEISDPISGTRLTVGELFFRRMLYRNELFSSKFNVLALGEDGELHVRKITDVIYNGTKEVFEVATACGKKIVATANHPLKTRDGWCQVGNLVIGNRIAVVDKSGLQIFWDKVTSIEPRGQRVTYDLTVEVDHNFVANGIIAHNSHSAGYALITYQTAYLKAHYPVEFMCASMTADSDKTEKVVHMISDCRAWGIEILPPEVNESRTQFTVVYNQPDKPGAKRKRYNDPLNPKIRFGLGAVRGIGELAVEAALRARQADGPFTDMYDFAQRVESGKVGRTVFEALVQCGGFDKSLAARGVTRAQAFAAVDGALARSKRASKDRKVGQTDMFGLFAQADPEGASTWTGGEYPTVPPWDLRETLVRERESLGFYVSGHPLDRYGGSRKSLGVSSTAACASMKLWDKVRLAGMVDSYEERTYSNGDRAATFVLEDQAGRILVRLKGKAVDQHCVTLKCAEPVLVIGKVMFKQSDEEDAGHGEPQVLLSDVVPYASAVRDTTRRVTIHLDENNAKREHIEQLKDVLGQNQGNCPVWLVVKLKQGAEAIMALEKYKVAPSDALLANMERVFGERVVELA